MFGFYRHQMVWRSLLKAVLRSGTSGDDGTELSIVLVDKESIGEML